MLLRNLDASQWRESGKTVGEAHESRREVTSCARSQPICPSLLELQVVLTSSLARMGCGAPGVAKEGRCDCAGPGSSTEVDATPAPLAVSDVPVVWPDLMSWNKSPRASFPLVTVVVTIVSSRPAFDARAGAEVGRVPASGRLPCAGEAAVNREGEVLSWPV